MRMDKKTFYPLCLCLILFTFFSCSTKPKLIYKEVPVSSLNEDQLPVAAITFKINPTLVNFEKHHEEKIKIATDLICKVVASKEFRDGIIHHTWAGKKQFVDNNGLSNEEIYNKILEATESYKADIDNTMDVELELFHESSKTIGYTFPHVRRIWMNKKYFDKYTPIQVSDNLVHEWLHKIGFDHSTTWSQERDHSVPYAVGYLVERLASMHVMPHDLQILGKN